MGWTSNAWRLVMMAVLWGGCGGKSADISPPKPKAEEVDPLTNAERAQLPPSKRLLGVWTLDLSKVSEGALTEEVRAMKERGLADKMSVEYVFHEGEFVMRKDGPGGPVERHYTYQIMDEREDRLELERPDDQGKPQRIYATFNGDALQLGSGSTAVFLRRK